MKACIENFSRELIRVRLDPPKTSTIFVDLIQFTPGQPEAANTQVNGRPHPSVALQMNGHPVITRAVPVHILPHGPSIPQSSGVASPVPNGPPPPPWTRMPVELPPPPSLNPRTSPVTHTLSPLNGPATTGLGVPSRPFTSILTENSDPLIPFKRKRKASVIDGSHDSVYVFEVEQPSAKRTTPPGPTPGPSSPLQQRSPRIQSNSHTGSSLNIIVQDPSHMAQQASRAKTSPVVTHQVPPLIPSQIPRPLIIPPSVLPSRDRTTPSTSNSSGASPGHSGFKIRLKVKDPQASPH